MYHAGVRDTGWRRQALMNGDSAVFVFTPEAERLARLRVRERARYGPRIEPEGDLFEHHRAFLEWAGRYDEGGVDIRSLQRHEAWMATLPCLIWRPPPSPWEVCPVLATFAVIVLSFSVASLARR